MYTDDACQSTLLTPPFQKHMDNPAEFAYYKSIMSCDAITALRLPTECEAALLERFLKAEAMALWTVRSARLQEVPPNVYTFLRKHEEDEQQHLAQFETMIGRRPRERERLPNVPRQWPALAVQLYGYESLGLEFATLLVTVRPDLASIREDELVHVDFFEQEIHRILGGEAAAAEQARVSALAWWRKLPRTVDRYLEAAVLDPFRPALTDRILSAIERRFTTTGLLKEMK
jgi:hypothetical protein